MCSGSEVNRCSEVIQICHVLLFSFCKPLARADEGFPRQRNRRDFILARSAPGRAARQKKSQSKNATSAHESLVESAIKCTPRTSPWRNATSAHESLVESAPLADGRTSKAATVQVSGWQSERYHTRSQFNSTICMFSLAL